MGDIAARPQEILAGIPILYDPNYYRRPTMMTADEQQEMAALRRELDQARDMYNRQARELDELRESAIHKDMLKRYCDNARAFGWECGVRDLRGTDVPHVVNSSQYNPFVKPDWDAHLTAEEAQFQLSARDVPL